MNDALIDGINAIVQKTDRLWLLGDFVWMYRDASKSDLITTWEYYRNKINCQDVRLCWGNHDPKAEDGAGRVNFAREQVAKLFTRTYDLINTYINGQRVTLSHYAMAIWDQRHRGAWNLYGHSHSGAENWLEQIMPGRYSLDCGVDNAYKLLGEYRPFSWTDICDYMAKRPGFGGHHHED